MRREAAGLSIEDLALRMETTPPVSARTRGEHLVAIEADVQPLSITDGLALQRQLHFDWDILVALTEVAAGLRDELPVMCRSCACSEHDACVDPHQGWCRWALPDLCTVCARRSAS